MEWLIAAVVVGGGGFTVKWWRERRESRLDRQEELEAVRKAADEDVTVMGEQLQRLGREVEGHTLDEATRLDYQVALDAYESAQRAVPRIRSSDEISIITDTLSSGRYALACVQARVAGRPVPELRVPCFFNPQHGPSVRDVTWTKPGSSTRVVPACAQDAARVANAEAPEVRTVQIGWRTVPYWEAGAAFQPYGRGYFAEASVMGWAFAAAAGRDGGADFGGYHGGGFDHHGGAGFDGGGGGGDGGM